MPIIAPGDFPIDAAVVDGTQLADILNREMAALASSHLNASRPPYITPGGVWARDDGAGALTVFIYAGGVDRVLASWDGTTWTAGDPTGLLRAALNLSDVADASLALANLGGLALAGGIMAGAIGFQAGAFVGSLNAGALTAARAYTLPDLSGALVAAGGAPPLGHGVLGDVRTITAAGATVWTRPAGLKFVEVLIVGGGAGGAGTEAAPAGQQSVGMGGSAGGWSRKKILAAVLGATETITIGAGGNGGAIGADGQPGGASSFGAHCAAAGGVGGVFIAAGAGAGGGTGRSGGVGSGGDLNGRGGPSPPVWRFAGGTVVVSGAGGNSIFGGGGVGLAVGGAAAGQAAQAGAYGAGGGGAASPPGAAGQVGGVGHAGAAIVWEYY